MQILKPRDIQRTVEISVGDLRSSLTNVVKTLSVMNMLIKQTKPREAEPDSD